MSTAHAEPPAFAHEGHGHDDHAHDFDGEPAHALPADEPHTPSWLPLLGVALFAIAAVAFLLGSNKAGQEPAPAAGTAASAAPRPATPPPEVTERPAAPSPQGNQGNPAGRLTPDQMKGIQELIDKERSKRGLPPLPAPGSPSPGQAQ